MTNYLQKYVKYKNKYLDLKVNFKGGTINNLKLPDIRFKSNKESNESLNLKNKEILKNEDRLILNKKKNDDIHNQYKDVTPSEYSKFMNSNPYNTKPDPSSHSYLEPKPKGIVLPPANEPPPLYVQPPKYKPPSGEISLPEGEPPPLYVQPPKYKPKSQPKTLKPIIDNKL